MSAMLPFAGRLARSCCLKAPVACRPQAAIHASALGVALLLQATLETSEAAGAAAPLEFSGFRAFLVGLHNDDIEVPGLTNDDRSDEGGSIKRARAL